jgi:hypothetical protein
MNTAICSVCKNRAERYIHYRTMRLCLDCAEWHVEQYEGTPIRLRWFENTWTRPAPDVSFYDTDYSDID